MTTWGTWPGEPLTEGERDLFRALYAREGAVVSRCALEAEIWPDGRTPSDPANNIKVRLCRLRRKTRDLGVCIETIRGEGLRFWREDGRVFPWEER